MSQLAHAVPTLMGILSRNGNNFNDVSRLQSSLQICSRIHKLSIVGECTDWDSVARMASQGNGGKNFEKKAKKLGKFVKEWVGGKKRDLAQRARII